MTRLAEPMQVPFGASVAEARTPQELDSALRIRLRVFVEEQGISPEEDQDGLDAEAVHVLAWVEGAPVATGRVLLRGTHAVAGRIAVLPGHRGRGLGGAVVRALEDSAAGRGATSIALHPHQHLEAFYRALGYQLVDGTHTVGAHRLSTMVKAL